MATSDAATQDPLLSLRRAIAAGSLPTPTTSPELSDESATEDLAKASYLYFTQPTPQTIPLATPTRFISANSGSPVDLRSILFAWQNKDVAIPEYFASANQFNETLKQKGPQEDGKEESVQILVFVERLDLITWLEGASDESEHIKPLEGAAAAAEAAATAAGVAQAEAAAGIAAGTAGGVSTAPSGAAGAAQPAQAGRPQKQIEPRLQEIYNGERKTGDRNTVLRGIKPTDFSHVRKSAEVFLSRNRPGHPAKPGSKPQVPAPSAGLPVSSSRKSSSSHSRPDPIILISPSASSLIRMSNVKSFLEDGVFVPPDHPTLSSATNANLVKLERPLRGDPSNPNASAIGSRGGAKPTRPTKFIIVDGTTNFKPEYWDRLVAVFTTGQTWQFKSYKWSSPPELFKHATGVYVGWRGEDVPSQVKGWGRGVQNFAVERWDEKNGTQGGGRWRDREIVEGIWTAIEEGMRLRGWSK